jgi:hypothetical protein
MLASKKSETLLTRYHLIIHTNFYCMCIVMGEWQLTVTVAVFSEFRFTTLAGSCISEKIIHLLSLLLLHIYIYLLKQIVQ